MPDKRHRVLIVDAKPAFFVELLGKSPLAVTVALPEEAMGALDRVVVDAVVVVAETEAARVALSRIAARHSALPCVVLANPAILNEESAFNAGAAEFVPLPTDADDLRHAIERAIKCGALTSTADREADGELIGGAQVMENVRDLIRRAAGGDATVLVRGESGTGKELVARAIHQKSPRADGPFVKIHCAALPDTLLESELFGYEKGAFTGAEGRKLGRVEVAQGGTLFLDEIGDITAAVQVKLLRLLQDREFERLGSTKSIKADVRFVAATHRDLESMVQNGDFREDLFYRLAVVPLWVPPLRARGADKMLLAKRFCTRFSKSYGKPNALLDDDALAVIANEAWPGNVRELENFIERMVVLSDDVPIAAGDVTRDLRRGSGGRHSVVSAADTCASLASDIVPLHAAIRDVERRALKRALARADGNRSLAARLLGINRGTLYNKLREYGLS